jgi:nicotinate-nucleotide pyrophosphorylase (carboxylating)
MFVPRKILEEKLKQMLAEDIGQGDVTVSTVIPAGLEVKAQVIAKQAGVAAGIEEATILGQCLGLNIKGSVLDGQTIQDQQVLLELNGDAQTILSVERTMLNVISRMSGIATTTQRLIQKINQKNLKTRIASTRKSAPGLLYFDKKAVLIGGGEIHRLHLDDMILIKDNHIAILGSAEQAVKIAKQKVSFAKKIEVEVTSLHEAVKAAEAGADIVMLDNFFPDKVKQTIKALEATGFLGKVLIEVSGGITEENFLDYAAVNVDIISLGSITHSVKALNVSLEVK